MGVKRGKKEKGAKKRSYEKLYRIGLKESKNSHPFRTYSRKERPNDAI